MGGFFSFLIVLIFGGSIAASSVKIINQSDEALVETLGKYNGKKLTPGLNFLIPFLDKVVFRQTIRERVLDIPPQQCITRDNVSITVDAVVYWRIVDMGEGLLQGRKSAIGDGQPSAHPNSRRNGSARARSNLYCPL